MRILKSHPMTDNKQAVRRQMQAPGARRRRRSSLCAPCSCGPTSARPCCGWGLLVGVGSSRAQHEWPEWRSKAPQMQPRRAVPARRRRHQACGADSTSSSLRVSPAPIQLQMN